MFGYVGAAGNIPYSHLFMGAISLQILKDTLKTYIGDNMKFDGWKPSIDIGGIMDDIVGESVPNELSDQGYVKAGFNLYRRYGTNINPKRIGEFIF